MWNCDHQNFSPSCIYKGMESEWWMLAKKDAKMKGSSFKKMKNLFYY